MRNRSFIHSTAPPGGGGAWDGKDPTALSHFPNRINAYGHTTATFYNTLHAAATTRVSATRVSATRVSATLVPPRNRLHKLLLVLPPPLLLRPHALDLYS
jgi:hypothetical protein